MLRPAESQSSAPAEDRPAPATRAGASSVLGASEGTPSSSGGPFPTARVREHIRSFAPDEVVAGAPEYMAAVLECVTAELLQRAGDAARDGASGNINPRHIRQAVRANSDLAQLVGEDALEEGGMLRPVESEEVRA